MGLAKTWTITPCIFYKEDRKIEPRGLKGSISYKLLSKCRHFDYLSLIKVSLGTDTACTQIEPLLSGDSLSGFDCSLTIA